MKGFLIALQFLTVLPVKIRSDVGEKDFGKSLLYFPVVGMLIGLLLSLTSLLSGFLSNLIAGAFILTVSVIITGGIHLDGFADTCDGFYQARSKEKILEIMRDSRIGVMGVIGIFFLLLLKFTLIVSISQEILWKSLIVMTTFGRWSQVLACHMSKYARGEGKAKNFIEYDSRKEFLIGSFLTAALCLSLMELEGVVLLVLSLGPVFLFISYLKRRIGGMTGDTIGATSEIAEIVFVFFVVISTHLQGL